MNRKMKILIAYDGSSHADAAIDDLRRAGLPTEAEAVVLTVADAWLAPGVAEGAVAEKTLEDSWEFARAASQRVLSHFPSWDVQPDVRSGSPSRELIRKADEMQADLLVVGSQGRSALDRLILGSVSQKVMAEARCSVRVARKSVREPEAPVRIIVGVDGSAYSDAAVSEVARRSWPQGSKVRVISAVRLPFTPTAETRSLPNSYYSQLEKAETEKAQAAVAKAVARLQTNEIIRDGIESEVTIGDVREVILDEAAKWESDMIALGSRGLGGFKRFLLGSVAQGVASYAPCSVEIIRSAQPGGDKQG